MRRAVTITVGMLAWHSLGGATAGDGARLSQQCLACHGGAGIRNGDYSTPRLSGQHPDYLMRAIRAYQVGDRKVDLMHQQVAQLTAVQVRAIAVTLAGEHPAPPAPGKAHPPREVIQVCGGCHGETGLGVLPETPVLSGQRADYLAHALQAYRSGERTNPVMRVYASRLTAAQVDELARYFAARGALRDAR